MPFKVPAACEATSRSGSSSAFSSASPVAPWCARACHKRMMASRRIFGSRSAVTMGVLHGVEESLARHRVFETEIDEHFHDTLDFVLLFGALEQGHERRRQLSGC